MNTRYALLLGLARAVVTWERAVVALWPAACVVGTFVALALLDVLPLLPDWLHALTLVAFGGGLVATLVRAWPRLRRVEHADARARLERDSALADRPLAALEDRLATGADDPLAQALWRRHRQRMAERVLSLRLAWPQSEIAAHEPWGIRAGVLLLLVVGLAAGYRDPETRLVRALDPKLGSASQAPLVELWITPPAYTKQAPLFLTTAPDRPAAAPSTVAAPQGSAVLVRATGLRRAPELRIGPHGTTFAAVGGSDDANTWRAESVLQDGQDIAVTAGIGELARWPLAVVADQPPRIAFTQTPAPSGNGLLSLAYRAEDDYGVRTVTAVVAAPPPDGEARQATGELRLALPLGTPDGSAVEGSSFQDLSAHPLAGQPVQLWLEAKDAAGQTGVSPPLTVVLPERTFHHPVARAIVAQRRILLQETAPTVRSEVARALGGIAREPDAFGNDAVVTLALAVAGARLRYASGDEAVASTADILWQTALRIEDGDVPMAEKQLKDAQERLASALQRNAPDSEIEQLMDELQDAIDRYLTAAAAELMRRGAVPMATDLPVQTMDAEQLHDLLDIARQLARTGARDAAQQMLAELQRMLDGLRAGMQAGSGGEGAREAQQMLSDLHALAQRQQALLDRTFARQREQQATPEQGRNRASRPPSQADSSDAAAQKALRGDLGDLMLKMSELTGSIPGPMGEAERAMNGAGAALGDGRLGDAVQAQGQAVDALNRSLDEAAKAMAQQLGGIGLAGPGQQDGVDGDPFGRSPNGRRGFATGSLKIPDRGALERAQEILQELRRRAAERFRSTDELDYINRLLRRF